MKTMKMKQVAALCAEQLRQRLLVAPFPKDAEERVDDDDDEEIFAYARKSGTVYDVHSLSTMYTSI